jgi:hypothetical protein
VNDDRSTDRRLTATLARIDGEVPLEGAAADHVLSRMLDRYDAELDAPIASVERHDVPTPRRGTWLPRAAAIVLVVAGIGALAVWLAGGDTGSDVSDQPSPSVATGLTNTLGFEPFAGYSYDAIDPDTQNFRAGITLRAGELGPDGTLEIRQMASRGGLDRPSDIAIFDIVVRDDGTVDVPLEFLDPAELGGLCTGGSVRIGALEPLATSTIARCEGVTGDVVVTATLGTAVDLPLLAEPVRAAPVTYVITPAGQRGRSVTLWFSDRGLVRHTVELIGSQLDLDLGPEALIAMEESR